MRLLTFFLAVVMLLFVMTSCDCGEKKCCGKKTTYSHIPEKFHKRVAGIKTHQQWIYTNGNGMYDTLRAISGVSMDFRGGGNPCHQIGSMFRGFIGDTNGLCETQSEVLFSASYSGGATVNFSFVAKNTKNDYRCVDKDDGKYNISSDKFIGQVPFSSTFNTPYKTYDSIVVLPCFEIFTGEDGILIFNDADGLIGYTIKADTMRLIALN